LRLFLDTSNEMARFFGLSLVRDWMQSALPNAAQSASYEVERRQIRTTMLSWLSQLLQNMTSNGSATTPFFLLSNAISVVTLSVKYDFPTHWPGAFAELLQLGYTYGIPGIDVVVKVFKELEVEVVLFSETRSKAEILTNTAVKDAMRESSAMQDIVTFLCNSAQHTQSVQRFEVCAACLHSLAELIAWIDTTLVIERALPTVYQQWQSPHAVVRAACLYCFYELVKKGMDPVVKVRPLQSVGLVTQLAQETRLQSLLQNTSAARPAQGGLTDDEVREVEQAGAVVDVIVLELFGCWSKYEDLVCGSGRSGSGSGSSSAMNSGASTPVPSGGDASELVACVPTVVGFLQQLLPLLLQVFAHSVLKVSCTALPSCTRLVALLRAQQTRLEQLQGGPAGAVFRAEEYIYPLLSAVYSKSQYPSGFDFEAALEDELDEETEVSMAQFRGRV
jgi:hypothetical protein